MSHPRIAVVGAGISGLAAAYHLRELRPEVDLAVFDGANRAGGVIETTRRDGYLIERSADSFITTQPWARDLCHRLGIADQLCPTNDSRRKALVVRDGKLLPVPRGFLLMSPRDWLPIVQSPVLSLRGKLRLAWEPWVRSSTQELADESVASFARRRLGQETFERLVQPLVSGIYTADPEQLSMAATMEQFLRQEREFGSLWRGARKSRPRGATAESGARYGSFVAPRDGMESLVRELVASLPEGTLRLNQAAIALKPSDETQWELRVRADQERTEYFDAVVLALPAHAAARLVLSFDPSLGDLLETIPYAGASIVCLGFRQEQFSQPIDAFGFIVPTIEQRRILAASFSSAKFPDRSPPGHVLVRVFVGGALQRELGELPDEDLVAIATEELQELMGVSGTPVMTEIARWPAAMPQYHVGHLERVARIESQVANWGGLELAGNAYRGVGVPLCVRSGEAAAERVADYLAS